MKEYVVGVQYNEDDLYGPRMELRSVKDEGRERERDAKILYFVGFLVSR